MSGAPPLPPELSAPLARFGGASPPAPAWFGAAVARAPDRSRIAVRGAGVELLTWGEVGKPGLLFLHGGGAHADWWSFIAPFFADDWRVAAISWSGMGNSDWRESYGIATCIEEIFAAVEAAGLEAGGKPVLVGHSFGGYPTLAAAAGHGERLRAAVSVDSPVQPPGKGWKGPQRESGNRVYPTLTEALARFRLSPVQPCDNLYIADFIARGSLKAVEGGWTWKFDPRLWRTFRHDEGVQPLGRPKCPIALMWGGRSGLMDAEVVAYMRSLAPAGTPTVVVPDADHHVMIDQPLAFVAALKGLLAGWP